jgi:hypothetical protein
MALVSCPDCGRQVSSRAKTCPDCACPVEEVLAEQASAARISESRPTRARVGEVDCVVCEARGYTRGEMTDEQGNVRVGFSWCRICEHTGRVVLCQSTLGYHAVAEAALGAFLAGEVDGGSPGVHDLGPERPAGHRYPKPGDRVKE